ncbi:MAG: CsgG/HfaB family protein [Myxococcota bacterium]|nr:CsgG/HfaB family protein [Myxococcota bacterium]
MSLGGLVKRHGRTGRLWGGLLAVLLLSALPLRSAGAAESQPGVAILYFDYTGKDEQLGVLRKGLAQMLISHVQPQVDNVQIVERERIEDIFQELELAESGKVDDATAAKVGKLVGARFLVVGSFFDLFGTLRVDSRLVEVETGKILGSVGKDGPLDDFFALEGALVTDLVKVIGELETTKGTEQGAAASPAPKKRASSSSKDSSSKGSSSKSSSGKSSSGKTASAPKKVAKATVVEYSKALDAMDRGDREAAKTHAKNVTTASPDFELVGLNLDDLVQ